MALKPPAEVPQGAMRFNSDSHKLEFYAQDRWHEMDTYTNSLEGGTRGIYAMTYLPSPKDSIGTVTIQTQGNSVDFGNLTEGRGMGGVGASRTRAVWGGGGTPSKVATIDYVTISTKGNASSFGSRTESTDELDGVSNRTRALFAGGYSTGGNPSGYHNRIDFVTIATTGNAIDFCDLVGKRSGSSGNRGCSDGVRGFFMASHRPDTTNEMIEVIQMASKGNAVDWGDRVNYGGTNATWVNNHTTALGGGGGTVITKWNMASGGDATIFGYYPSNTNMAAGMGDSTRAIWGGASAPAPASNIMQYVQYASEGQAADFGDMFEAVKGAKGTSDAHGGL